MKLPSENEGGVKDILNVKQSIQVHGGDFVKRDIVADVFRSVVFILNYKFSYGIVRIFVIQKDRICR